MFIIYSAGSWDEGNHNREMEYLTLRAQLSPEERILLDAQKAEQDARRRRNTLLWITIILGPPLILFLCYCVIVMIAMARAGVL